MRATFRPVVDGNVVHLDSVLADAMEGAPLVLVIHYDDGGMPEVRGVADEAEALALVIEAREARPHSFLQAYTMTRRVEEVA